MDENILNNNELPKEIQADNDNTNPLLDIIQTLQEKLDSSPNQNTSNSNINANTYSNNINNNFSNNTNNSNINYDFTQSQNQNINQNNGSGFDIGKIFEMLNGFSSSSSKATSTPNPFANIDMDTMMRMGKIFTSMNKEDPRKNLLLSLKPFLRDNRQKNVDTYIFILGILNVLDSFNNGDSGF